MSTREVGRAAVLQRVVAGDLSLTAAVPLLAVSYRQAKRLLQRFRGGGARALVHRSVGQASNRARPSGQRAAVLALVRAHYSGPAERGPGQRFGPTLTAEHLRADHGVGVSVTTLTRWMRAEGLWGRRRRGSPRPQRRVRKPHFGELVQLDGSFHDWFEGRGPRACMMTMVDDATGQTLLRVGAEETTWAAADILQAWIAAYGVPLALYVDRKSVYLRAPTAHEAACGVAPVTQFGRMCQKLGIQVIGAGSPQAKGRVERGHGTHQDRLIKKLRLQGIADVATANAYLAETYLPAHNARFAVPPAAPADYHRPREPAWADADVFCLETPRVVGADFVVQYHRQGLQLDRSSRGRVPAKSRVVVRELQDGTLRLIHQPVGGRERVVGWTPAAPRLPKPAAPAPPPPERPVARPSPEHPWRHQHRRWQAEACAARDRRTVAG